VDCEDVAFLLAAGDARTLTTTEEAHLHDHLRACPTCHDLTREASSGERFRWVARIPEDALADRDLLVLPTVDPIVFEGGPQLARGGMGRIVRAHDRRLGRDVAIKEVLAPTFRARFEREVAITAKLQHPAIVPVYEAGTWPNGTTFYTMRLVPGGTLDDAIAKTSSLEDRLALLPKVIAVTDALAYAHEQHVVHRDLKPGNVLVGEHGETVVIDWGLAKELDTAEAPDAPVGPASVDLTGAGSVMGTPCYIAPEQAAGEDVDERCDVYALGAILYTLLAGVPPYHAYRASKTPTEMLAIAIDKDPEPIGKLVPRAPVDLRVIVERAMARDRAVRYATAKEMAEELRRFEAGQLLRSREYTFRERLARWVRRHRAAVVVGSIAAVIVTSVGIGAIAGIASSRSAERDARIEAERAARRAEDHVAAAAEEDGRNQLLAGDRERALAYLADAYHRGRDSPALRHLLAVATRDLDLLDATTPGPSPLIAMSYTPDGHVLTIAHDGTLAVWDGANRRAVHRLADGIDTAAMDPAGRRAIVIVDGVMHGYDVATGAALWGATHRSEAYELEVNGDRFVAIANDDLRLYDAATGATIVDLTDAEVAAFSADGKLVAGCGGSGSCQVWDTATGRLVHTASTGAPNGPARAVAFVSADRLVVGAGSAVELHDLHGGPSLTVEAHGSITAVAIAPGGERIATGDAAGVVRLWDAQLHSLGEAHDRRGFISRITFSPDGEYVLAGGSDHRVHVWEVSSLALLTSIDAFHGTLPQGMELVASPHRAAAHGLAWAPGGARFATLGDREDRALIWRVPHGSRVARFPAEAIAVGGEVVVTVDAHDVVTVRRLDTGEVRTTFSAGDSGGARHLPTLTASRDGRRALLWHVDDGRAVTCDLEAGHVLAEIPVAGADRRLQLSADGRRVVEQPANAETSSPLRIYDTETARMVRELPLSYVAAVSPSPDGDRVAAVFGGFAAPALWSVATGERLAVPILPTDPHDVAFAPDGRNLLVFGGASTLVVDLEAQRVVASLVQRSRGASADSVRGAVDEVRWDDTAHHVALHGYDPVVALWDLGTGALLGTVDDVPPGGFAITSDGGRLATASSHGNVRISDVMTGRLLEVIPADAMTGLAWSHDGTRLVTLGLSRTSEPAEAMLWDVRLEQRSIAEIDELAARTSRWLVVDGLLVERR
jgi:WD40 repeat protein